MTTAKVKLSPATPLPASAKPVSKNVGPIPPTLAQMNPQSYFHVPPVLSERVPLPLRLAAQHLSKETEFYVLFFGSPQILTQYLNLFAQHRYSEVTELFRSLINADSNKKELLLDHMFHIWPKNAAPLNLLILDLLNSFMDTIPGMRAVQLLRGAVLITQEKYTQGIIQIRESLVLKAFPQILEKYFWLVLKQLCSSSKLLQVLENPWEAILPSAIYFFKGMLALLDRNVPEAKLWLERSITADFTIEQVERILDTVQRDRSSLQEISFKVSKAADPSRTVAHLSPPRTYVEAAHGAAQTLFSAPILPPAVYCDRAHLMPPPPAPTTLSIPGHAFFMQFFGTQENFLNNQFLFDQNRFNDQVAFYRELILQAPQRWKLLLKGLFELFPRRHNIPDILALTLLSELNPEDPLPYILTGCFHIHDNQYEQGINLLNQGYAKEPSVQILGTILTLMLRPVQTLPTFLKPETLKTHQSLFLGIYAFSANRQDLATIYFEQALADPTTQILAQAFRHWMGITDVRQPSLPTPPASPESVAPPASPATRLAAETLACLCGAPASPVI